MFKTKGFRSVRLICSIFSKESDFAHGRRLSPSKKRFHILVASFFAAGLALSGCSSDDDLSVLPDTPVDVLYNDGLNALIAGESETAVKMFDEVERQYPYSKWATKAQIMAAYAYYKENKYDEAIAVLDRFIELHPAHEDITYAHYLKGVSYYEQISDVERDQSMTKLALESLEVVVDRWPKTSYARDAGLKIDLTRDHLAGKHMTIGRFYQQRQEHLPAINRFMIVLDNYQTTTHVPEALLRLVESYTALGLVQEARAAAEVLGHNYPGSEWYANAYELVTGKEVEFPGSEDEDDGFFSSLFN
ncbi:MAG: outer membrane protein assembly factor BamD [Kiloniellales bacterium]|nr:outer membrane protein assembly factor BamD [Kiloniellales bacterium]